MMTPEELGSAVKSLGDDAENYSEYLQNLQRYAFEYYEAQPFGNEIEGRSQIILPDVQEVLDDTQANILRMFVSGDKTIEFEATSEEDEDFADEATQSLDYNFMRNGGDATLNDVLNDGNLRKIGVFKSCKTVTEKVSRAWEVVPAEALPLIMASEGVEDIREYQDETGAPMAKVLVKTEAKKTVWNVVSVPTHEFRFTPNGRDVETCAYVEHAKPTTRSDLVAMGFDREQVYSLPGYVDDIDNESESDTLDQYSSNEPTEELTKVELCEGYARIDFDGDGIAELIKVCRVENEILRYQGEPVIDELTGEQALDQSGEPLFEEGELAVETVDEQPFSIYCPFPRPHRMVGYSQADKVMDIQYGRSLLARQMMDGMTTANNPRPIVAEDGSSDETLDDILNPIPGSPIRTRTQGAVVPYTGNFNLGQSLQAMEWFSREKEARSGSGRSTPVASEDALNNMTATEFQGREAKGEVLQDYMARNFAVAFGKAVMKLYRMMRVEAEPFRVKVDGKYKVVDPTQWPEDMNMVVRVGLGRGAKDKRINARVSLLGPLREMIMEGVSSPEHLYNQMDAIMRDYDLGRGSDIMFDPEDPEVAQRMAQEQQEPSPELLEVQMDQQRKTEMAQFDAQLRMFELERKLELETAQLTGQLDLAAYRAETEAQLAAMKTRFEMENKANLTNQRMGGSVAS